QTTENNHEANAFDRDAFLERFGVKGKTAVVTGASSGLGVTIALGLAAAGANLVIGARRTEQLEKTKKAVEAMGQSCVALKTDVTNRDDCFALADAAQETFGKLDILVNNAGIGGDYNPATEDPPEHW